MKHRLTEYIIIAMGCGILLYVIHRMFRKTVKEGLLPPMSSLDTIANTAGIPTQTSKATTAEESVDANPLPPGQAATANAKTTSFPSNPMMKGSTMYNQVKSDLEKYEKDPAELAKFIAQLHDHLVSIFSKDGASTMPEDERNAMRQITYRQFDDLPNEFKPRILKLASTNADFKKIIASDPHFKPYAYRYTNQPESGDAPNYADPNQLPLKEYFIKASYNSVYDGTKQEPSINKLKEILYNGCRYIDLQVFSIDDPKTKESRLYVAYGEDDEVPTVDTTMPLSNVLTYINTHAFNKDGAMTTAMLKGDPEKTKRQKLPSLLDNYIHYPLFLMFRIYRKSMNSPDIVKLIYDEYLNPANDRGLIQTNKLYLSEDRTNALPVSGNTSLHTVQGKILICMDIDNLLKSYTESYDPIDIPETTKATLRKYVNVKSGGHTWKTFNNYTTVESGVTTTLVHYTDGELSTTADTYETNVKNWFLSLPNKSNKENPSAVKHARDYKIQVSPCRYYIDDANLGKYNDVFDHFKTPMIPMSQILDYKG